MFHPTISSLFFIAALLLLVVGPSISRPLPNRATASTPASSHHRFFRRASSSLSPSPLQRRSNDVGSDNDDLLSPLASLLPPDDPINNLRRSLDTDSDEPQDDYSTDQEKADAEKEWEEFVASTPDEDPASYPDSFGLEEESDPSYSDDDEKDAPQEAPNTSTNGNDSGKDKSSSHQSDSENKPPKSNDSEAAKKKDAEAAKKKAAQADKKGDTESAKKSDADDEKRKEAEAAKQQQAEADKEKQAEADKQKQADEEKQKEADAAQAKKDAEEARKKQAASKTPDNYQITDVKPVPGTSVTTGTAHKDHSADSYSTPSGEIHTGDATFYEPDLGACGITNRPTDMIVAVSHLLYDSFPSQGGNPNTNAVCGKKIRASYQGKSVEVTVVDRCEGCDHDSLDFTITAFEKLGSKDEGRLHGMTWTWV